MTFLCRLEADPLIELVGIFSQSPRTGISGIVEDLWQRRSLLAVPLLLTMFVRSLYYQIRFPRSSRQERVMLRRLRSRTHFVKDIHDSEVLDAVRRSRPDLGLVYGGPIVKPQLFDIPGHGTLGIHHGMVPRYRGKKTTFWAMFNGEDQVGVTIQKIGSSLDGGDVVAQQMIRVGLRPLPRVKHLLEKAGIELYLEAIHAVKNGSATFTPQPDESGVLYSDPGPTDILRLWIRYFARVIRHPASPNRALQRSGGESSSVPLLGEHDPGESATTVDVCVITETFHPVTGGGETQARILAAGLATAGATVHVVTRRSDGSLPKTDHLGSVTINRVSPTGVGHLKKWGMMIPTFIRLLRLRRDYDVIIVCGFRVLGIPALLAGGILRKPCLLKADSLGEFSGAFFRTGLAKYRMRPDGMVFRGVLRMRNKLFLRASAFIAISQAVEEELVECGVPRNRICRIPNSVDTQRFCPAGDEERRDLRRTLGIPETSPVVVYTGRLETNKGLPMLLSVWKNIAARYRQAHLLLVGSGGLGLQNCEKELREFVRQNSLDDTVEFVGSVDDVRPYLQASDLFVFPTRREAFGISVIEAMACGLPVISTATGGLADIAIPEKTAIVFPVDDAMALDAAFERYFRNDEMIPEVAAAGRDLAVSRFSEARVLTQYSELLAAISRDADAGRAAN